MTKPIVTVAIPTFNRAVKLRRTLLNLFDQITTSGLSNSVEVFVSNNNSQDSTSLVLLEIHSIALEKKIIFRYVNQSVNIGFSRNFLECALLVSTKYMVILGDDDNLYPNSLSYLTERLMDYQPNVLIFNYNQKPWDKDNPLYPKTEFFKKSEEFVNLNKLVKWYKVCGVTLNVENKKDIEILKSMDFYSPCFAHVLLCILNAKKYGNIILDSFFFSYPDEDYLSHVNFAPYVGEILYKDLSSAVDLRLISAQEFNVLVNLLGRQSVFSRSIYRLHEFYKGNFPLTLSMKKQLWSNIADRLIFQKSLSREGLLLKFQTKDVFRLIRMILVLIKFKILLIFKLSKSRIEKEGF